MQPLKQKIAKLDGRSPLRAASDTTPPQWCVGVVAAPVEGESLVVHSGGLLLRTQRAASCLLHASEAAVQVALEGIQALGGNGYINEFSAGRILRDAKLYAIGAGTNEIRRMLIGRELFAGNS